MVLRQPDKARDHSSPRGTLRSNRNAGASNRDALEKFVRLRQRSARSLCSIRAAAAVRGRKGRSAAPRYSTPAAGRRIARAITAKASSFPPLANPPAPTCGTALLKVRRTRGRMSPANPCTNCAVRARAGQRAQFLARHAGKVRGYRRETRSHRRSPDGTRRKNDGGRLVVRWGEAQHPKLVIIRRVGVGDDAPAAVRVLAPPIDATARGPVIHRRVHRLQRPRGGARGGNNLVLTS